MTDLAWTSGAELEERLERLEPALYLAAFGLALTLRWLNLGAAPLGDAEANWALQALQLARPDAAPAQIGPNPAYIVLTGLSFWLLGAADFLARAWPALSGALLVGSVFLFRRDLGRATAVVLAFGMALDPGLVTVARQAGGPMLALAFTLLALGLWRNGRARLAGFSAGLALLGGASLFPGLLALALGVWASRMVARRLVYRYTRGEPGASWEAERTPNARLTNRGQLRAALVAMVITLALAGTAFLRLPQGLPAFFGGLTGYLEGWSQPGGVTASVLLLALAVFELLPLIFALIHLGRASVEWETWEDEDVSLVVLCGVWAAAALLLALVYPARQTADLVWAIVPLWTLAAREITRYLGNPRPHLMTWMQALMALILAALFWITLTTTPVIVQPEVPWETLRLAILAGIFVLAVLTSALVALGWNWTISRDGAAWGGLLALLVYTISVLWGASQLRPNQPQELWAASTSPAQARLLTDTIHDLSLWERGMSGQIEIVSTVDAPSLRWALRSYPNTRFSSLPGGELSAGALPAIIITSAQEQSPELSSGYRGQDFAWQTHPGWEGALPENLRVWFAYRQAPILYDHLIVWARSDLFPGANDQP